MANNFPRNFGPLTSPVPLSYIDDNFARLESASTSTVSLAGAALVGFMQSGSGASASDVQTQLRKFLRPSQFGAVGDGVTDDAAAWALTLTAAGSANFEIWGDPGKTYLIGTAGITVTSKTNARIVPNGAKLKIGAVATQTVATFGATSIKLDSCTDVDFAGWDVDGNSKATNLIGIVDSTRCGVRRNKCYSAGINGLIVAAGNTRNKYEDNECHDGLGTARGMWIGNTNALEVEANPSIRRNECYDMGATGIGGTISGGCVIDNDSYDNVGSGIAMGADDPGQYEKAIIALNRCHGNTFHGIQSDASTDSDYTHLLLIALNQCYENDGSGIYGLRNRDSVYAVNMCWNNNADASGTGSGIQLDLNKRVIAAMNMCFDTRSGAARTQSSGLRAVAQTNALDVEDLSVVLNHCNNNLTTGIDLQNSGSGTIAGLLAACNYTNDNGTNGLQVVDSAAGNITEVTVVGNHASGNGTSDLRVDPPDAVIEANRFSLSPAGTMRLTFTSGDTTPSVKGRRFFRTNNGSATTITFFDDGVSGQEIVIQILDANTTIDFTGTNLLGNAGADWSPANGDWMTCVFDGSKWYCDVVDVTA